MKIQFEHTNNIVFGRRNKYIRKADDIQRKSNLTFPLISSSYIQDFSPTLEKGYPEKIKEYLIKIINKIDILRDMNANPSNYGIDKGLMERVTPFALELKNIKESKYGNCHEKAIVTLAALTANGYYDSKRAGLYMDVAFKNKETGQIEYKKRNNMDHTFVLTTMNNKCKKPNDYIVVDSWFGFADSISGAKDKYAQKYKQKYIDDCLEYNKKMFKIEKMEKGININLDDYETITNFKIETIDFLNCNAMKMLGEYANLMFEDLVV